MQIKLLSIASLALLFAAASAAPTVKRQPNEASVPGSGDEAAFNAKVQAIQQDPEVKNTLEFLIQQIAAKLNEESSSKDLQTRSTLDGVTGDATGDVTGNAGDVVGGATGDVTGNAGDAVGDVAGKAGDVAGKAGDAVGDVAKTAGQGTADAAGAVGDAAGDVGVDAAGNAAAEVGNKVGDAAGKVGDTASDLTNTTGDVRP
ncbi:hypothetical protein [Parasitella parasitica]|uniref:Uncharacterized protein n=1 Tax=Parasitella parasitica TaxID=35722 RepID=A0A0B7NAM7_9FUNG|nr:hypothetical protein [Parasitella parasitica]